MVAGFGRIGGMPVALIGFDRFATSDIPGAEGRPMPAGFRKARRLLDLAERWKLPVVSFVDTPGAYPGIESEASGLASEIARTLERMSSVKTPSIAVVVGEGGSGGALALALADKVLMQRGTFFSVISRKARPRFCIAMPIGRRSWQNRCGLPLRNCWSWESSMKSSKNPPAARHEISIRRPLWSRLRWFANWNQC